MDEVFWNFGSEARMEFYKESVGLIVFYAKTFDSCTGFVREFEGVEGSLLFCCGISEGVDI